MQEIKILWHVRVAPFEGRFVVIVGATEAATCATLGFANNVCVQLATFYRCAALVLDETHDASAVEVSHG